MVFYGPLQMLNIKKHELKLKRNIVAMRLSPYVLLFGSIEFSCLEHK